MKRIILADSCLELNGELEKIIDVKLIPLNLDLGNNTYKDDESLDIRAFVDEMHAYQGVAKTAAPSPQDFFDAMEGYDEAFIVTISSKLSTVYNSAVIAKNMMNEKYPDAKVHIFDSRSAVTGETLIAYKIQKLINEDAPFEEIVEKVEAFRKRMLTFFILENLDNLVKNGRMSKIAGKVASVLSITPVCQGVDGEIQVSAKVRGMKAGLKKLVDKVLETGENFSDKTLMISHALNEERAILLKEMFLERAKFKEVFIVPSKGVTSIYANEGGIVVAV